MIFFVTTFIKADPNTWSEFRITLINGGANPDNWELRFEFQPVYNTVVWDENNYITTTNYQWGKFDCAIDEKDVDWDFIVPDSETYSLGRGLYRITAKKNGSVISFFDFDARTSDGEYGIGPDVGFYFDIGNNNFLKDDGSTIISTWNIQKLWDLTTYSHITADLEPFAPQFFTIESYNNRPELNWEMFDGVYVQTYKIYRSIDFPHFGTDYIGSTTDIYYVDYDLKIGSGHTAYYTVKAVNGNKSNSSTEDIAVSGFLKRNFSDESEKNLPTEFKLHQNYPNPFNPSTTIKFSLKENAYTRLTIYNANGEIIISLVDEFLGSGNYSYIFNAQELACGIYYYNISASSFQETKKLILLK